jgi:16S rRNA (guanine966-N2)-methyltransferase
MKQGKVRIIAGRLRGSRLGVAERPGLRPSSDRVRETLFNWLQDRIIGRRCLDLFAGTGALGFEAASRGAAQVLMVERDRGLAAQLKADAARLNVPEVRIECADALQLLGRRPEAPFDLVFIDPPFADGLYERALTALQANGWLASEARIYVEAPLNQSPKPPSGWQLLREGQTREVDFKLYGAGEPPAPDTLSDSVQNPEFAPA